MGWKVYVKKCPCCGEEFKTYNKDKKFMNYEHFTRWAEMNNQMWKGKGKSAAERHKQTTTELERLKRGFEEGTLNG